MKSWVVALVWLFSVYLWWLLIASSYWDTFTHHMGFRKCKGDRQSHLKVKPLLRNWSIKGKSFMLLKPCQLLIPNSMHLQSRPRVQQKWVEYLNSGGAIFISLPLSYHCVSQNWQLGVKDTKEPCHRIWIRGVWTNCFLISVHEENVGPNSWFLPSANLFYLLKGTCQFLSLSSL